MANPLDRHAALIYTMVLASAAEGQMSDAELEVMGRLVKHLPVFRGFDVSRIAEIGEECCQLLRHEEGLEMAISFVADALSPPLRETAYALACDVMAADGTAEQDELRMLEMMRHRLVIDRLAASAIEYGARVRHRAGP